MSQALAVVNGRGHALPQSRDAAAPWEPLPRLPERVPMPTLPPGIHPDLADLYRWTVQRVVMIGGLWRSLVEQDPKWQRAAPPIALYQSSQAAADQAGPILHRYCSVLVWARQAAGLPPTVWMAGRTYLTAHHALPAFAELLAGRLEERPDDVESWSPAELLSEFTEPAAAVLASVIPPNPTQAVAEAVREVIAASDWLRENAPRTAGQKIVSGRTAEYDDVVQHAHELLLADPGRAWGDVRAACLTRFGAANLPGDGAKGFSHHCRRRWRGMQPPLTNPKDKLR